MALAWHRDVVSAATVDKPIQRCLDSGRTNSSLTQSGKVTGAICSGRQRTAILFAPRRTAPISPHVRIVGRCQSLARSTRFRKSDPRALLGGVSWFRIAEFFAVTGFPNLSDEHSARGPTIWTDHGVYDPGDAHLLGGGRAFFERCQPAVQIEPHLRLLLFPSGAARTPQPRT